MLKLLLLRSKPARFELKRIKHLKKQIQMTKNPDIRFKMLIRLDDLCEKLAQVDIIALIKEMLGRHRYTQNSHLYLSIYEIKRRIEVFSL